MGLRIIVVLRTLLAACAILAKEVEATIRGACSATIRTLDTVIPGERLGHRTSALGRSVFACNGSGMAAGAHVSAAEDGSLISRKGSLGIILSTVVVLFTTQEERCECIKEWVNFTLVSRGDLLLGLSGAVGKGRGCGTFSRSFMEIGKPCGELGDRARRSRAVSFIFA